MKTQLSIDDQFFIGLPINGKYKRFNLSSVYSHTTKTAHLPPNYMHALRNYLMSDSRLLNLATRRTQQR